MAMEIREIEVRMRVDDGEAEPAFAERGGADGSPAERGSTAELVDECVRRVLAVLAARKER